MFVLIYLRNQVLQLYDERPAGVHVHVMRAMQEAEVFAPGNARRRKTETQVDMVRL